VKKTPTSHSIEAAALARMNGGYAQSSVPLLAISAKRRLPFACDIIKPVSGF
jgi:hypothetical protein